MLTYLFQVTVCLAAFYMLYLCLLSRETFFGINRWYLLGTLLLSLSLPLLSFLPGLLSHQPEIMVSYSLEPVVVGFGEMSGSLGVSSGSPWWMIALLVLYWSGVCVMLGRCAMRIFSIRRIYMHRTSAQLDDNHTIVYSTEVYLPFSFFRWIFLPVDHRFTAKELDEILAHESAHVRAWHSIDILLIELACILLWPSPVIYFYRKSLRRIHEYLADAAVLQDASLQHYGRLLLAQASPRMQLALAHQFFHAQLKHRILMMTKDKSRKISILKYATLLPVVAGILVLFAFRQSNTIPDNGPMPFLTDTVPGSGLIFKVVEEMPRYPGCEDSGLAGSDLDKCAQRLMLEHIYHELQYPVSAKEAGIQGRSIVQFVVRYDGTITDAVIVRSIGYGTDKEVLRVVNTMPKWRPGHQQGKAVDVQFTLPVQFKLDHPSEVYAVVEEMPRFPGCEASGLSGEQLNACASDHLIRFVQAHMRYPEAAVKAGVEGKVVAQFVIRADGSIDSPKIVRTIGHGTDEVVIDIIKAMPQWRPGYKGGKAVDVEFHLPVVFKLPVAK
jgi:TonB family protein